MKLAFLLASLLVSAASAQDDSLFEGSGSIVREVKNDPGSSPDDDLLAEDTLGGGGDFHLLAEAQLTPGDAEPFAVGLTELSATLFLDARPSSELRTFVKGDVAYAPDAGASLALRELFADFDVDKQVFVRAGKQTVNWGVGYFFSPANLINLEEIDPEDPEAELSGPASVKAQVPIGTDNVTGYLVFGDGEGLAAGGAARYEFLVNGYEVTAGAIVEDSGHYAVMTTGSGSVADVSVFAEAVLEGGSEKVFVVRDPDSPGGLTTSPSDSLFFSGTLGGRYSTSTDDDLYTFSVSAQYYFNGLGYDDAGVLTADPAAVAALIGAGELSVADLQGRGRHYGAVNLSMPDFAKSGITPSVFWLGNLGDGSGLVSASLSYGEFDHLTPRLEYALNYGGEGAEYSPRGAEQTISLSFAVDGSF